MSLRPSRPLLLTPRRLADFAAALLCIWAALGHTPAGALLRTVAARLTGTHTRAQPLLAYFSSGVYESAPHAVQPLPPPTRPLEPGEALGAGAFVALSQADPAARAAALATAQREGVPREAALDPRTGPHRLSSVIARLTIRHGSEDLAMIALFCGDEAARYALRAAGVDAELPALVRALPESLCDRGDVMGQALALATALSLDWPLHGWARVSSPFGMRDHPTLGVQKEHRGVDLAVAEGTPVFAGGRAHVRHASEDDLNGKLVVLDHGRGVSTAFLHNSALLVERGDDVSRGQQISRSGNTGRSTGPHLHYQLELSGVAVDPLRYRAHP